MKVKKLNYKAFDSPLDPGIAKYVKLLSNGGVETFESCEGGPDHSYSEPTIRFHGDKNGGFKALDIAFSNNLPVKSLARIHVVIDGELTGPYWEMVFHKRI